MLNNQFNMIDCSGLEYTTADAPLTGGATVDNVLGSIYNQKNTINYKVVNSLTGAVIEGAKVTVKNATGTYTGTSDANGDVSVTATINSRTLDYEVDTAGGVSTIIISKSGYVPVTIKESIDYKIIAPVSLQPVLSVRDLTPVGIR
jgi:hypothetical protein